MSEKKKTQGALSTTIIVLLLVFVILLGGVMGGTMAWLLDASNQVVNTFTYGDINITLTETETSLDGDLSPNTNTYEMVPGSTIIKDPLVTVIRGSEDHWLFVKMEKSGGANDNFDEYLSYQMADGWNALNGVPGVYYQIVTRDDTADQTFRVIKDDTVTVLSTVTKEMINALDKDASGNELAVKLYPQLAITAYAVQYTATSDAQEAWVLTSGAVVTTPPAPNPGTVTVTTAAELKSAIANAGTEPRTINMAAGTYDVGDFDVLAGKNITLNGTSGTIIEGQMKLYSNLTIDGITFNCGGQTPLTAYTGITVRNCIFNDPYMYAVEIAAKPDSNTEVNFTGNTVNAGTTSGKGTFGGLELEGAVHGCRNLTITGSGNTLNDGGLAKAAVMYYCGCGLVEDSTIVWNTDVTPVHGA
ncbi:MAG: hypothetical protein IJN72_09475 [Firmicutes bacterium]|nr:hypothetical protein [Bacillota bacterium]